MPGKRVLPVADRLLLGVNIDHIATLREARGTKYPDPVAGAFEAMAGGADFITLHLREDRRHIQDEDVEKLKVQLPARLNLEMAATDEMVRIACRIQPSDVALVPEKREELTTEGGLDVVGNQERIKDVVSRLTAAGIRVSLFVDPVPAQLEASRAVAAPLIELHTGHYADATTPDAQLTELRRIQQAALIGAELGLVVNAGHGLHLQNLLDIALIPQLAELNIGHSIIARSVFIGLQSAVREIRQLMDQARGL